MADLQCCVSFRCIAKWLSYTCVYIHSFFKFLFGCTGSLLLHRLFSSCSEQGLVSSCGVQDSHCRGFSCREQAVDMQASEVAVPRLELWHMGLVALQHVGSSQTRDWTCVSCAGRWIPYYWATREAPPLLFRFFSHIGHYRVLSRVPCAIQ